MDHKNYEDHENLLRQPETSRDKKKKERKSTGRTAIIDREERKRRERIFDFFCPNDMIISLVTFKTLKYESRPVKI